MRESPDRHHTKLAESLVLTGAGFETKTAWIFCVMDRGSFDATVLGLYHAATTEVHTDAPFVYLSCFGSGRVCPLVITLDNLHGPKGAKSR